MVFQDILFLTFVFAGSSVRLCPAFFGLQLHIVNYLTVIKMALLNIFSRFYDMPTTTSQKTLLKAK